eukprot:1800157-Pyramimonas_sp.AAC.1
MESRGLSIRASLTMDAESVSKSSPGQALKKPTECTWLGHICCMRQMTYQGKGHSVQCGDARDMTADGHAEGRISRALPLHGTEGNQSFKYEVKKHIAYRGKNGEP